MLCLANAGASARACTSEMLFESQRLSSTQACRLCTSRLEIARRTAQVHQTVAAGGKVLIPVMAVGRAQELLLLLENYWERMGLLVPIYFSAGMVEKANLYFKLFASWTSQQVQHQACEPQPKLRRSPATHSDHLCSRH